MNWKCFFGFHQWDGCVCSRCAEESHTLVEKGGAQCRVCHGSGRISCSLSYGDVGYGSDDPDANSAECGRCYGTGVSTMLVCARCGKEIS